MTEGIFLFDDVTMPKADDKLNMYLYKPVGNTQHEVVHETLSCDPVEHTKNYRHESFVLKYFILMQLLPWN